MLFVSVKWLRSHASYVNLPCPPSKGSETGVGLKQSLHSNNTIHAKFKNKAPSYFHVSYYTDGDKILW